MFRGHPGYADSRVTPHSLKPRWASGAADGPAGWHPAHRVRRAADQASVTAGRRQADLTALIPSEGGYED